MRAYRIHEIKNYARHAALITMQLINAATGYFNVFEVFVLITHESFLLEMFNCQIIHGIALMKGIIKKLSCTIKFT